MTTKKWVVIAVVVVVIAAALLAYKLDTVSVCATCRSRQLATQWRLGEWGDWSIPLMVPSKHVTESRAFHDLFTAAHRHTWIFAGETASRPLGVFSHGCAIGSGLGASIDSVGFMYESDAGFREFIQEKLRNGSLTKERFLELMTSNEQASAVTRKEAYDLVMRFMGGVRP